MKSTHRNRILILLLGVLLFVASAAATPLEVQADPDYGTYAYEYLRYLTDHYGYRVNNKDILPNQDAKLAAGEWINSVMTGFGYTARTVTNDWNPSREFNNYVKSYCYLKPGASTKRIVIGAHYDSVMTKGTEDNGTGVSVVLELARRLKNVETPYAVEFCFWDGEETLGFGGSFNYVRQCLVDNNVHDIVLYINLDCVGSGDRLLVCGGQYKDNLLVQSWGYNMARALLDELGIDYMTLPKSGTALRPPESLSGSDQHFFATQDVPYVYFLCTAIYDENGEIFYPAAPSKFHTADPRVEAGEGYIRGQIIHTPYDDLDVLEALFPGRILKHFNDVERIVVELVMRMTDSCPVTYADPAPIYLDPSVGPVTPSTEEPTTEEPTTEEPTTVEPRTEEETTSEPTKEPETTIEETTEEESSEPTEKPSESEPEVHTEPSSDPERSEEPTAGTEPQDEKHEHTKEKPWTAGEVIAAVLTAALVILWLGAFVLYRKRRR